MEEQYKIRSYEPVNPMIYAYTHIGVAAHKGAVKIGYTEKQTPEQRIAQQNRTADIRTKLEWAEFARYLVEPYGYFKDTDFHNYLVRYKNVKRLLNQATGEKTEWFKISPEAAGKYLYEFRNKKIPQQSAAKTDYTLREEQKRAVEATLAKFSAGGRKFLWNAKPRFGKTLTAYDLIRRMGCINVLVVTNRPSISNSWADDFNKFIGWRDELCFVSETDALRDAKGVYSRQEYIELNKARGQEKKKYLGTVAFESLQGLKGSLYFGGSIDKLKWIKDLKFNLLIVDESQEGVKTMLTENALKLVKAEHILYLSGTPFKQLYSGDFGPDEIFEWSYEDEQEAKANWSGEEYNPYERLPKLNMYLYEMSQMIIDRANAEADLSEDGGKYDFVFDLNEFFYVDPKTRKFVHEEEVRRFLRMLCTGEKYPYSTPELRGELSHTLWLLNRVASAKALAKLLKEDEVFKDYEIVIAAGDGRPDVADISDEKVTGADEDKKLSDSLARVRRAIKEHGKTITLSVGQLTVGVTVPEWSGVMMLSNIKSASSYMQAAFRSQNPCTLRRIRENGTEELVRKENAYVFDFDPARTLILFEEFANNLRADTAGGKGTAEERKGNIERLLKFFPLIGEDDEGRMVGLDAEKVMSIPRKIKCREVVRQGFMCNYLFSNISNVFGMPGFVTEILRKLEPAQEERRTSADSAERVRELSDFKVDEEGDPVVDEREIIQNAESIFSSRVNSASEQGRDEIMESFAAAAEDISAQSQRRGGTERLEEILTAVAQKAEETIKTSVKEDVLSPALSAYDAKKSFENKLEREVSESVRNEVEAIRADGIRKIREADAAHKAAINNAQTEQEVNDAENGMRGDIADIFAKAQKQIEAVGQKLTDDEAKAKVVKRLEENKKEEEKREIEDDVRARLRGFSRTIPSFIMAYGDGGLTLANFDRYAEPDVFLEVTGITIDDFRLLRDGGDIKDPVTGESRKFKGHLFDETVFDDSIQEFLKKKRELADYFDESVEEDIFSYIPPQRTNQIFTPRKTVNDMLDRLEEENPGCFDDPDLTFADLYMKSGLYIAEIVKRLFRSERMKERIPDDSERIHHILTHQVYGMMPSRIIYLIARNYILGFDEEMIRSDSHNFVQADAAEAAKNGTLKELVDKSFS